MSTAASVAPQAVAPRPPDPRLDEVVDRAQDAARAMRRLDQEAVDRIVWAMVVAGLEHAIDLAELAMEETGFGVLEDKVVKNYIATEFLFDYLRDKRSVGVIDEDHERGIQYVAEPIGVVLALLPITNPTSTALFKSIVAAKTRNAVIFRPSARAVRCAQRAAELLQEAGEEAGLPANALQVVPDATPTRRIATRSSSRRSPPTWSSSQPTHWCRRSSCPCSGSCARRRSSTASPPASSSPSTAAWDTRRRSTPPTRPSSSVSPSGSAPGGSSSTPRPRSGRWAASTTR